jgi:arylsulfatase A-like enzyme
MPSKRTHSLGWATVLGGVAGLVALLVETAIVLRTDLGALRIDVQGPAAVILRAVKPMLPALFGKIAVAYLAAGAVAGLVAWLLGDMLLEASAGRRERWAAWALELATMAALAVWWHAIQRPALFDDLSGASAFLAWTVDSGEPWHPLAAGALWLALHGAVAVRVHGVRRAAAAVSVMVGGLVLWNLPATPSSPSAGAPRPLVVLLGIDAFRPDRLAAFGATGQVAPNVDAFVKDATLFTRAYTPIAQTEPAWRTMLTARWPHRTGVRYPLTAEQHVAPAPTFVSALADKGYATRFQTDCSRFHYQPETSGFGERVQPPRGAINFLLEKLRFRGLGMAYANRLGAWWLPEFVDNRALAGMHDPRAYAERLASDWVSLAERGPALLAYHATAAHFPGDPSYPHYRKFVSKSEPLDRRLRMVFQPLAPGTQGGWSRAGAEALYDELLAQADEQVGIILGGLKRAGLYDNALIVVFSDHGESFHADTPELAGATSVHGARLSAEENQVLLAVKLPKGERAPARVDDLVRLVDLGPSILEHAGAPPLKDVDGERLLPLIRGVPQPPRWLYAETGFSHASPEVFVPEHLHGYPRSFEAYQVRDDGVVVMSEAAHEAVLKEKDVGVFDGEDWLVRVPLSDGTVREKCTGSRCAEMSQWLDRTAVPRN